jgi:hypothetical protein
MRDKGSDAYVVTIACINPFLAFDGSALKMKK